MCSNDHIFFFVFGATFDCKEWVTQILPPNVRGKNKPCFLLKPPLCRPIYLMPIFRRKVPCTYNAVSGISEVNCTFGNGKKEILMALFCQFNSPWMLLARRAYITSLYWYLHKMLFFLLEPREWPKAKKLTCVMEIWKIYTIIKRRWKTSYREACNFSFFSILSVKRHIAFKTS